MKSKCSVYLWPLVARSFTLPPLPAISLNRKAQISPIALAFIHQQRSYWEAFGVVVFTTKLLCGNAFFFLQSPPQHERPAPKSSRYGVGGSRLVSAVIRTQRRSYITPAETSNNVLVTETEEVTRSRSSRSRTSTSKRHR